MVILLQIKYCIFVQIIMFLKKKLNYQSAIDVSSQKGDRID